MQLDIGQQLEDVQNGNTTVGALVKEWNARLQGVDYNIVQKFKAEFANSNGLPFLLDQLLLNSRLTDDALKEIEIFFTHYYGGAYRELAVNLRALFRAYVIFTRLCRGT